MAGSTTEFSTSQMPLPGDAGHGSTTNLRTLALGSIGVVYSVIGTSSLYALK